MCRFSGFFVNDYMLYIARDSSNEVHVLAVFGKEWLSFACNTSMENVGNFWLPLRHLLESHLPNVNHRGHWKPCNEVSSQNLAECFVWLDLGTT